METHKPIYQFHSIYGETGFIQSMEKPVSLNLWRNRFNSIYGETVFTQFMEKPVSFNLLRNRFHSIYGETGFTQFIEKPVSFNLWRNLSRLQDLFTRLNPEIYIL